MRRLVKNVLAFLRRLVRPEVKNPAIILIGDSLIAMGNWQNLLNRNDLINRGIGGETFSQIRRRMKRLQHTTARIIFIEGGINDFPHAGVDSLFAEYELAVAFWQANQIIPVVTGLVYISPLAASVYPSRRNWMAINNQVSALNEKLKNHCTAQLIDFIDLNVLLSDANQLRAVYTTDGVHLTESAYYIWAEEVSRVLKQHHI